ncbi:nematocyst expressed protein 3-like [Chionomys nivalis]|uniref:nematocyst expressed protein 3-like n=1 Tax=Chionomys nivalis TaxID=269649 RepID=UPI00259580E3|nr:nematocyst expressed protein 3-like [Chionomys nivalis]
MPPRVGGSPGPADPYPPQAAWLGAAPTPRARQPRPGLQPLALARRATPGARKMEAAAPPGDLDPSFPRPRGPGGGALTVAAPRPSGSPARGSSCPRAPAATPPLQARRSSPSAPAARAPGLTDRPTERALAGTGRGDRAPGGADHRAPASGPGTQGGAEGRAAQERTDWRPAARARALPAAAAGPLPARAVARASRRLASSRPPPRPPSPPPQLPPPPPQRTPSDPQAPGRTQPRPASSARPREPPPGTGESENE